MQLALSQSHTHTHTHTHTTASTFLFYVREDDKCILLFAVMPNGMVVASEPNPAVSAALLKKILLWKLEGCSDIDVIVHLQQRTVLEGYKFHPWIAGE